MIIPKFVKKESVIGVVAPSDGADNELKVKRFKNACSKLESLGYKIKLSRIKNILDSAFKFTQFDYSKEDMTLEYFEPVIENDYGRWSTTEKYLTTLS